jgi:hypothetical protein
MWRILLAIFFAGIAANVVTLATRVRGEFELKLAPDCGIPNTSLSQSTVNRDKVVVTPKPPRKASSKLSKPPRKRIKAPHRK